MNPGSKIAAVVLAAGRSSRMGVSKPLLPLGSRSAVERVVESVARTDVGEIVVVTGHEADRMTCVLAALPVRQAHNPGYDVGMFSSVQSGVGALREDTEAFFILPVDYPLVRHQVVQRLIDRFHDSRHGILHPTCCGLRGHPPLLSGRYRTELLRADATDNLRSFLQRNRADETEVELEDISILVDMDTPEDYRRMERFANILDSAASGHPQTSSNAAPAPVLTDEDSLFLLSTLKVPERVVRHSKVVTVVGDILARALEQHDPSLDAGLVHAGCLLHDLARVRPKHAAVGGRLLANAGLKRLAAVVGSHMVLQPEQLDTPTVTEEQLVYLADKLVIDDRVSSLEQKKAHALRKHKDQAAAAEGARARMVAAETIAARVETVLGRPLEEVLPRNEELSI